MVMVKLKYIHRTVFKNFTYMTDKRQYDLDEKWVMPDIDYNEHDELAGDCEDFALACRKLVREAGIDNSRLVFCLTESGGGHCVLEVDGCILDSRQIKVKRRDDINYEWVAISGYNSGDPWKFIKN